ncbi:MAG: hypothetical protein CUN52_14750 [Phototrophicales bacterium]|jgi:hypothetical protein|nr:MAG: hypothetical protein CUN52_14750 [Phototrophicales bacterium]
MARDVQSISLITIKHTKGRGRNNIAFIESTVIGRGIFAVAIIGLILFGYATINMILFPIIDLLGAGWSFYALREVKKSG